MFDELLKQTGIPADGAEKSVSTCPGKIFFLQRDFLEKYWTMAALPPDKLEMTAAFAAELEKIALADANVQSHIGGATVRKVICVPGRLVNIVAK